MNTTRLLRQLAWGIGMVLVTFTVIPFCRLRTSGRKNIPRKGPILMLGNHTTFFDPVLVYWSSLRRVHGVGTDQALKIPVLGPLVPWFSVIAFAKGTRDRSAMAEITKRSKEDAAVLIFPEGGRSWTGTLTHVKPSNGRLAKTLACPVVCFRFVTGHLHWPRWATYPRMLPVHIEYLPPRTYGDDVTDEEATADIIKQITIDPDAVKVPRFSWGFRLAWGLPDLLWACPACHSLAGLNLVPSNSAQIACPKCAATWQVDLACRMNRVSGPAEDTTVDKAWHAMQTHFGELPVVDTATFAETGLALDCASATLWKVRKGRDGHERLGTGRCQLFADRLDVHLADGVKTIQLTDIGAAIVQLGSKLHLRMDGHTYQVDTVGQSPQMWRHFLAAHIRAAKAAAAPNV